MNLWFMCISELGVLKSVTYLQILLFIFGDGGSEGITEFVIFGWRRKRMTPYGSNYIQS